jgi:hypothetical protein
MKRFVAQVVGWLGHGTASGGWSLLGMTRGVAFEADTLRVGETG